MAPQSTTPLSPSSAIGSTTSKKSNLLNLFTKRKGGANNSNSRGVAGDGSKPSRLGSLKSSTNGSRSRSKGDKLQKFLLAEVVGVGKETCQKVETFMLMMMIHIYTMMKKMMIWMMIQILWVMIQILHWVLQ